VEEIVVHCGFVEKGNPIKKKKMWINTFHI
jgi:hypothetical protein